MTLTPVNFILGAELVSIALATVCTMIGMQQGKHLSPASPNELVSRKPFILRIGGAFYGVFILLGPFMILSEAAEDHQSLGAAGSLMFLLMLTICIGFGGLSFRLAGPDELHLHLDTRTYSRITGWPFFPQTRSGPWLHFWGVYVGKTSRTDIYIVGIRSSVLRERISLGHYGSQLAAERFADEMAAQLDLPRVPPPSPLFEPPKQNMTKVQIRPSRK